MKVRVAFLSLVTVLCLVGPMVAGPIPIGAASSTDATTGWKGGPGPDFVSSLHSSAPGNLGSYGDPLSSLGSGGIDRIVTGPMPPTPAPVPEPSGLMVMMGSGLFGAGALLRRKLKA